MMKNIVRKEKKKIWSCNTSLNSEDPGRLNYEGNTEIEIWLDRKKEKKNPIMLISYMQISQFC